MENTKNVVAFEEFLQGVIEESPRKEISSSQVAYDILLGVLGMNADQVAGGFFDNTTFGNSAQAIFDKKTTGTYSNRTIAENISRNIIIVKCVNNFGLGKVYRAYFVNKDHKLQSIDRASDTLKVARVHALAIESVLRQTITTDSEILQELIREKVEVLLTILGYR